MIKLTLVPYTLRRDSFSGMVVVCPFPYNFSRYFTYDSESASSCNLLDFDFAVRSCFLDSKDDSDLAYCYLVVTPDLRCLYVRPYLVDDLALGLVSDYNSLVSYIWDFNFEDKRHG